MEGLSFPLQLALVAQIGGNLQEVGTNLADVLSQVQGDDLPTNKRRVYASFINNLFNPKEQAQAYSTGRVAGWSCLTK
jgi:hypothetical protein